MRIRFAAPGDHPLAGVVAVGLDRKGRAGPVLAGLDPDGRLRRALKRARFDGEPGETETLLAPAAGLDALVVAGTGGGRPKRKRLRRIGGALFDAFDDTTATEAVVAIELDAKAAAELAYGLRLRSYPPTRAFRTRPDPDDPDDRPSALEVVTVLCVDPTLAAERFAARDAVAQGVFLARDLTDRPANRLGPAEMADQARRLSDLGVEVVVMDAAGIEAAGLNLLAAVGRGSARPPCLVTLRWAGAGGRPMVLVGKGITFDSGGLSIKADDEDMDAMKADMAGAGAVLGAIRALAGRRAGAHVVGVLALAENMPSGRAQRPGDVWSAADGKTVEVLDTDAEGRLVLADALAWAAKTLDPKAIIDIATLTGSVEELLGGIHAGLYASDDRLARRILKCARAEEEPLWRLPLSERCDEDLKSEIADLRNCSWDDVPDNDDAARFLWHFVPERIPWAHIDMAGLEFADEDDPLCPETATGFGVRLFDALAGG